MKIQYGRTRSGKIAEIDWGSFEDERFIRDYSKFTEWPDRIDSLSMYEALWLRGRRMAVQQEAAKIPKFEQLVTIIFQSLSRDIVQGTKDFGEFQVVAVRISHGRNLLFSEFREGW